MPSTLLTPRGEANLDAQATGCGVPIAKHGAPGLRDWEMDAGS